MTKPAMKVERNWMRMANLSPIPAAILLISLHSVKKNNTVLILYPLISNFMTSYWKSDHLGLFCLVYDMYFVVQIIYYTVICNY